MNWFLTNLLWTEGFTLVAFLSVAAVLSLCFFKRGLYVVGIAFAFCFFFFRNPERVCTALYNDPTVLVCPADGWVVGVDDVSTNELDGYDQRVSIFLTPFDVHVNWMPCSGIVEEVAYHRGTFALAFLPKSSDKNERNDVVIKTTNDSLVKVRQIAGTIARTIVCWAQVGQGLFAGQKFGMIKFGSRVEVFLPKNVQVAVTKGQRVKGGETVLGNWR